MTTRPAPLVGGPHGPISLARARDPRGAGRRLARTFLPYRAVVSVALACVVLQTLIGLAGPYLMSVAIDRFIAERDAAGLARIALWMLAAFVLNNGLQLVGNLLMARASQDALRDLRRDLFGHVQRLPMSFFDANPSGELMSRLTNDIEAVNQAVSQNVTSLVASILSMVGIVVAMFVLDVWLALASLLVVPLMLALTRFIAVYTRQGFQELQDGLGGLNAVMEESIGGLRVVKVFRRTASASEAFRQKNEQVYRASVRANSWALLLMPVTTVLGNLFVIVLAGLGGWLALQGLVSVGVIAAFISYGQNFVTPLRQLSILYNTIQAALAGAERVFEILDLPPEVDGEGAATLPARWGHVVLADVGFSYRPGTPVLHDLSLEAAPGEVVALVGPTGAGKTTILNLLERFYEADRGTLTIDGVDLRRIPRPVLRKKLGIVLQDTFLFSASVLENIRYGRLDATDEEVKEAARLAEADTFIRQLPRGYDTLLSERGSNLSQGQRQLLAIARTLLADPAILILDEATSSVDTRTEAHIQRSLLRLMQGRTSFVIAHRLSTIRDADQVLVIDDGTVVEHGTHTELLARRGEYHRLYTAQFKGEAI